MSIHANLPRYEVTASPVGDDVVLLDEQGHPVGRADRLRVHTDATPLHLAFSTYLFNARGEVLVTRRALGKTTWPGVWTNSACGHPRPGEDIEDAARRRIREELGLVVGPLIPVLPDFRYRATDASGIVENEMCPVFAGFVADEDPRPDPAEVADWAWVPWEGLATAIAATCVIRAVRNSWGRLSGNGCASPSSQANPPPGRIERRLKVMTAAKSASSHR